MFQDGVEVTQVIRKKIGIDLWRFGQAKAAPVRRDDMPVVAQAVDHELERGGHVHPAVQHEQLGRTFCPPMPDVVLQSTDRDKF